jgi:hypothetical protein
MKSIRREIVPGWREKRAFEILSREFRNFEALRGLLIVDETH